MSDSNDSRPQLIRPLIRADEHLAIVRERQGSKHKEVEHPHCEEHFLFTPHCAACIEAEKTQQARATATRVEQQSGKQEERAQRPPQSSRSFVSMNSFPSIVVDDRTLTERIVSYAAEGAAYGVAEGFAESIVDALLDD